MRAFVVTTAIATLLILLPDLSQAGYRYPRPKPVSSMTLQERAAFQVRALAHYKGAKTAHAKASARRPLTDAEHRAYRWYRAAVRWTVRELAETRRLLRPPIVARALRWFWTSGAECVKSKEGGWGSATGNGYFGGFQMDTSFQYAYGREFVIRWGLAHLWPPWAQIVAAFRGWLARGWNPWPNTSRTCGLR